MEQLQYQEGRTEIGQLGKVRLIDRLTADTGCTGDDCAVLGEGREKTLVTVQTMVEGVDFDMMYTPLKHLGYKAVAIAISNIAAMNGTPRQALVSLAVSNRYSVEALDELYAGVRLCCDRYDVSLVGGDTASTRAGMVLSVTLIGSVDEDKITYRHGARHNDLLCVSGDLGSAYAGLLVLESEKVTYQANPNFQPDLDGFDYVLERFLKPEPRMDIVKTLAERGVVPTSMTDVSEGLADSLLHLCQSLRLRLRGLRGTDAHRLPDLARVLRDEQEHAARQLRPQRRQGLRAALHRQPEGLRQNQDHGGHPHHRLRHREGHARRHGDAAEHHHRPGGTGIQL